MRVADVDHTRVPTNAGLGCHAPYTGQDGLVVEERTGQTIFRGGVNIDLGGRHYGLKRVRATYPVGRLTLAEGEASLWVSSFGALPRSIPLSVALTPDAACVLIRHSRPPGVTFKTATTAHHFWTLHPGRIMEALKTAGFQVCS